LLTAIIIIILECAFLAFLLIIICAGAVAVLLLFVLMVLETKLKDSSKDMFLHFPLCVFVDGFFFFELANLSFNENCYSNSFSFKSYLNWYNVLDSLTDLEACGQLLCAQFVLQVLIVGLILFLASAGVSFLATKPVCKSFKSQTLLCQLSRTI